MGRCGLVKKEGLALPKALAENLWSDRQGDLLVAADGSDRTAVI
jgi:hypothetical protein